MIIVAVIVYLFHYSIQPLDVSGYCTELQQAEVPGKQWKQNWGLRCAEAFLYVSVITAALPNQRLLFKKICDATCHDSKKIARG